MTAAAGARNLFKADAGVVHALLQARYYDGSKGEFLSEDPVFLGDPRSQVLTDPQSLNSYSYANDNPITKSDPNGRFALSLNYSANAEEGFGGFTSTYAGGGASFVLNPSTMQAWIVYTSSGANNVGYLKSYQSTPDNGQTPFVLGMYAGKGRSIVSIRCGPRGARLRSRHESSRRTAGKLDQRGHSDDFSIFPPS